MAKRTATKLEPLPTEKTSDKKLSRRERRKINAHAVTIGSTRAQRNKIAREAERRKNISCGMTLQALENQHSELEALRTDSQQQRASLIQFHADVDAFAERMARDPITPDEAKRQIAIFLKQFRHHRNDSTMITIALGNLELKAIEGKNRIKAKLLDKVIPNATPDILNNPNSPLGALAQTLSAMFKTEPDEK